MRFDLVVTQEVFEHVFDYRRAFREVMRTVRPGARTSSPRPSISSCERRQDRAVRSNGQVVHLAEPEYHGNPIDSAGRS